MSMELLIRLSEDRNDKNIDWKAIQVLEYNISTVDFEYNVGRKLSCFRPMHSLRQIHDGGVHS
jgi:hypothetical protein